MSVGQLRQDEDDGPAVPRQKFAAVSSNEYAVGTHSEYQLIVRVTRPNRQQAIGNAPGRRSGPLLLLLGLTGHDCKRLDGQLATESLPR